MAAIFCWLVVTIYAFVILPCNASVPECFSRGDPDANEMTRHNQAYIPMKSSKKYPSGLVTLGSKP